MPVDNPLKKEFCDQGCLRATRLLNPIKLLIFLLVWVFASDYQHRGTGYDCLDNASPGRGKSVMHLLSNLSNLLLSFITMCLPNTLCPTDPSPVVLNSCVPDYLISFFNLIFYIKRS